MYLPNLKVLLEIFELGRLKAKIGPFNLWGILDSEPILLSFSPKNLEQ